MHCSPGSPCLCLSKAINKFVDSTLRKVLPGLVSEHLPLVSDLDMLVVAKRSSESVTGSGGRSTMII